MLVCAGSCLLYMLQIMNFIFYKQYETIKLILVTVLQSVNRDRFQILLHIKKPMLQRLNLRTFHLLYHQLKEAVAIVEPKRL